MKQPQVFLEYQKPGQINIIKENINEKTGEKSLTVSAVWQVAGKINKNRRLYPTALLKREVEKVEAKIKSGETVWGAQMHPRKGIEETGDISHKWNSVSIDEKTGICTGQLTVLPTSSGRDIQVLLQAGRLGISSRGNGTVVKKSKKVEGKEEEYLEVQPDYSLQTPGDFVPSPSVSLAAATVNEELQILENKLNDVETKEEHFTEWNESLKVEASGASPIECAWDYEVKAGTFEGTFDKYKNIKRAENFMDKIVEMYEEEVKIGSMEKGSLEEYLNEFYDNERKVETEHQKALKDRLDEELAKDKYSLYKPLIEAKLMDESGKVIFVETVEEISAKVEELHNEYSKITATVEKAKIEASGLKEKGHIENPEDEEERQKDLKEKNALFQEARKAGFKGNLDEWQEMVNKVAE